MEVQYMSGIKWSMQKYHKKHDNVHYINKNYVLKPIYNNENKCINDTLSKTPRQIHRIKNHLIWINIRKEITKWNLEREIKREERENNKISQNSTNRLFEIKL